MASSLGTLCILYSSHLFTLCYSMLLHGVILFCFISSWLGFNVPLRFSMSQILFHITVIPWFFILYNIPYTCIVPLDLEPKSIECIWIEIDSPTCRYFLCWSYRPPRTNSIFWNNLSWLLDKAIEIFDKIIIVCDSKRFELRFLNVLNTHEIRDICRQPNLRTHENHEYHVNTHWHNSCKLLKRTRLTRLPMLWLFKSISRGPNWPLENRSK